MAAVCGFCSDRIIVRPLSFLSPFDPTVFCCYSGQMAPLLLFFYHFPLLFRDVPTVVSPYLTLELITMDEIRSEDYRSNLLTVGNEIKAKLGSPHPNSHKKRTEQKKKPNSNFPWA